MHLIFAMTPSHMKTFVPVLACCDVEFLIPPGLGANVMQLLDAGSPAYIRKMRKQAIEKGYISS